MCEIIFLPYFVLSSLHVVQILAKLRHFIVRLYLIKTYMILYAICQ